MKRMAVIFIAVFLLLLPLIGVNCESGGDSEGNVEGIEITIKSYISSYNNSNLDECIACFTGYNDEADAKSELTVRRELSGRLEFRKIKDISFNGQVATVKVTYATGGDEVIYKMQLSEEDNNWKILWDDVGTPLTNPQLKWEKTFGGPDQDEGCLIQKTSDRGYIIIGYTDSYRDGNEDVWLIKTDELGNVEWNKTFGGKDSDNGKFVQQTSDGGYIIAGNTWSYGAGKSDVWLIKTDPYGNEEWNKTFGGPGSDCGNSVQQTSDGGYIIAGNTWSYGAGKSDVWLIKTDPYGNEEWDKVFGDLESDSGYEVQQTSDGGYIVVGELALQRDEKFHDRVWLIKTDYKGHELWAKIFGGSSSYCIGMGVQQTIDGGYIITGRTFTLGIGHEDTLLIKTDSYGNEEWSKTFAITGYSQGRCVQQAIDGGYIILGNIYGGGWLIRTDSNGNELWSHIFAYENDESNCYYGQLTYDGNFIIVGNTSSGGAGDYDVWLIKMAVE